MTNLCNHQANRRVSAAVSPTIVVKNTAALGTEPNGLRVLLHNVGFGGRNGHNPINVQ
jgi:hypothetical protein